MDSLTAIDRRSPVPEVTAPRIEVKIPVPHTLLPDAVAWVRVHPAHWRRTYPRRQVNNIYFDSLTYWGLNANLGGLGDRAKLRLRWYGACLSRICGAQLEMKCKSGTAGWKQIMPVDCELDLATTSWSRVVAELEDALSDRAAGWLRATPVAVLINAYDRDYYATPDGELRLTIDHGLLAYGQRAAAYPNLSRPELMDQVAVIELKAPNDAASRRRLVHALAHFPISVSRFSKYVQGATATPDLG